MKNNARFLPNLSSDEIAHKQLEGLKWTVNHAFHGSPFYRSRLEEAGIGPDSLTHLEDIKKLPLTTAQDLKDGYPFPLLCVPEEQIVRIHGSSGTTGKRKIMSYTQKDIDDWKTMFARCYELAELTPRDRIQICVGYGLWTAGAGFQLGCEHHGAMALPIGPGLLDIQIQMLEDLQPTALACTASMALLMGEEIHKRGIAERLKLRKIIFGAEPHTPKMRKQFETALGVEASHDISGMTELYGPGAGLECKARQGIHYWADYYIAEILDPETLQPVEPGEIGELVVTTLKKEAAPLIRYRTRDLTRLLSGSCPCGCSMPRHDKILGRSDDMFIFRGVNIYPGQIASILEEYPELSSEYQIQLHREAGLDHMCIRVERKPEIHKDNDSAIAQNLAAKIKRRILVTCTVAICSPGSLPRSFAKTKRIQDNRE